MECGITRLDVTASTPDNMNIWDRGRPIFDLAENFFRLLTSVILKVDLPKKVISF